ncbi:unnamed protein product [Parnassius apollo]|uniref:(apollo) hypothetical protein n=1 Tax=Parnassius apollo TaxID=110799 RepID=A0A8S3WHD3_PARAO|nr:unnamed protein product [Parnassius apollo]
MAKKTLGWLVTIVTLNLCMGHGITPKSFEYHGICKSMFCNSMEALNRLKNCTVVLGNLHVLLLEKTRREHFTNVSFPKLKEITGFLVVYRVRGLESLGQLFPNLARIRGAQLLYNYALIVYDMPNLEEIGLYSLLKIDRGGVIIWTASQACFIDTVDWKSIAPGSRHVLSVDRHAHCNIHCTCSRNALTNHCWNNRKCQRYLEGPEGEKCKSQCLGCRKTNSSDCSVCRHYTFRGQCVSECPNGTVVLPVNKYCLNNDECNKLDGWSWNNTCIFECPLYYVKEKTANSFTCRWCRNCTETCGSQFIRSIETIQAARRCVYINGSLTIHISSIPEIVKELQTFLSVIQEVSDHIVIYGSIAITSLDFLSSLKRIGGRNLERGKYSLTIYDMRNLQTLFLSNVTENLKVDHGTVNFYGNPMLCMSQIEKLQIKFPIQPNEIDVPQGMNGYSGGCTEVSLGLQVRVLNETSALVMFSPVADTDIHYSLLYVKLPQIVHEIFVPETCSESEWFAVDVPTVFSQLGMVQLSSLYPASSYAICIETYDPVHRNLARSKILSFKTLVGKPEPPFISELVASSPDVVVIRWVNHKNYISHISHYELDVNLIEIHSKDILARDHCVNKDESYYEIEFSRHAVVLRPPPSYEKGCESMCGVLSSVTEGAMTEEYFEVCNEYDIECGFEHNIRSNKSFGKYVQSLAIDIKGPRNDFQIGGLAPFRDYKFKLRACTENSCSRSARSVVRTLSKDGADIPSITVIEANLTGYVTVYWNPPLTSNGPILSYTVEVLPSIILNDFNNLSPQVWCISNNTTNLTVKSEIAMKYIIRVCATTLGSSKSCTGLKKVYVSLKRIPTWWWTGILFGVILFFVSTLVGWLYKNRRNYIDRIPLIDNRLSYRNETEPPSFMMTDLAPIYSIPLRDTRLD